MSRLHHMRFSLPAAAIQALRLRAERLYERVTGRPIFSATYETQVGISFRMWLWQRVFRRHSDVYWPIHPSTQVLGARYVVSGADCSPGWSTGCLIDGRAGIYVGDYTQLAPNVRLLSCRGGKAPETPPHDFSIRVGRYSLLAMNVTVHPGVELGDFTIVGAGSVVTDSFPEGHCVIGGNPARLIKRLDPAECERWIQPGAYVGYFPESEIAKLRGKWIDAALFDKVWGAQ